MSGKVSGNDSKKSQNEGRLGGRGGKRMSTWGLNGLTGKTVPARASKNRKNYGLSGGVLLLFREDTESDTGLQNTSSTPPRKSVEFGNRRNHSKAKELTKRIENEGLSVRLGWFLFH